MRVLLVGAGSVGQVYGYHFHRGGAKVAFFVRDKYAEDARRGFDLYSLNRRRGREAPAHFDEFDVFTDMQEATKRSWDMVVLCLPASALRTGAWFEQLATGLGDATLVNLTPGIDDYRWISERVPQEQIVSGLIGLSSWSGPLPGATLPKPGTVYWVPPLTKMAFSGPRARTRRTRDALDAGGLPSKVVDDTRAQMAFEGPAFQFFMAALELAHWNFEQVRNKPQHLALSHRATREAFVVAAQRIGKKPPLNVRVMHPWVLRIATRAVRYVVPFDMALFLEKHFSKVGEQTTLGLTTLIELAETQGNPADAMKELLAQVVEARAVVKDGRP
ncbi:MAG: hypothetical protein JRH11_15575 [Deltaproteobacteria bacterium]|nr:hypothetical protein [Deltaproteobacteria bacterium]